MVPQAFLRSLWNLENYCYSHRTHLQGVPCFPVVYTSFRCEIWSSSLVFQSFFCCDIYFEGIIDYSLYKTDKIVWELVVKMGWVSYSEVFVFNIFKNGNSYTVNINSFNCGEAFCSWICLFWLSIRFPVLHQKVNKLLRC